MERSNFYCNGNTLQDSYKYPKVSIEELYRVERAELEQIAERLSYKISLLWTNAVAIHYISHHFEALLCEQSSLVPSLWTTRTELNVLYFLLESFSVLCLNLYILSLRVVFDCIQKSLCNLFSLVKAVYLKGSNVLSRFEKSRVLSSLWQKNTLEEIVIKLIIVENPSG